ncbi:hypothetical protein LXL04_014300 [Taraxacum kok-saghyz]
MVGEPISLQHIAELPNILPLDGNPTGKVHYIGGTNVLIKFPNTATAKAFYDNEHNWNRWFKWLKMGFNDDLPQERLAWVTILGLPIRFRSAENYERIANTIGKSVQSDIQDWTRYDLSDGNIKVVFDNNTYHVGMVEYDRDWKPYDQPVLVEPESEKEEEEEDMSEDNFDDADDEEFVNDTDSDGDDKCLNDEEIEDGEIVEKFEESTAPATAPVFDNGNHGNHAETESTPTNLPPIITSPPSINSTPTIEMEVTSTYPFHTASALLPNLNLTPGSLRRYHYLAVMTGQKAQTRSRKKLHLIFATRLNPGLIFQIDPPLNRKNRIHGLLINGV